MNKNKGTAFKVNVQQLFNNNNNKMHKNSV